MSGHTKGPWEANGNGIHKGIRCVATTHMDPKQQRDIDAKLIAAAPDLLEALEQCLEVFIRQGWDDDLIAAKNARAAIAKVKGES